MKKGAWLNAEDTLSIGFVDEIITPDKITNYIEDERLVAMIAASDMPPLPRKNQTSTDPVEDDLATRINKVGESLIDRISNLFPNKSKTDKKMSKTLVLASLCAVMAVDAIEMTDDGVFLNKEQLDKIEAELKKLQGEKVTAETNLTTANSAKDTAVNSLSAVTTAMDELDSSVKTAATPVAKVEAIRAKLASKPGAAPTGAQNQSDQTKKPIAGADSVTAYAQGIV
jgi:hypothetical protein